MLIIARHTEVDPDDRDGEVAVIRDPLTRACDAHGRLLRLVRLIDTPEAVHIRYRVRR